MTLREAFNSILDYPIEFNFDPWGVAAGAGLVIAVLLILYSWYFPWGGDNGWYI